MLEKISQLEKRVSELKTENEKLISEDKKLKHDLMHDSLTGLNTKKYLEGIMEETISSLDVPESERRIEGYRGFSLLFCDVDNFKKINDMFGHNKGNDVLKKVSEIINDSVRVSDIVCRWGGDEIVVGLMGANEEKASQIGEKIRVAVEKETKDTGVTVSIGVIAYEKGLNMQLIVEGADKAMYWAKKEGKNKVIKYSDFLEEEKAKKLEEETK